ncbi:MAG: tryptophan 7-halogenase [Sulfurovum sp.]|nr:tryptophan 7-halogenase [Sulfurovum sp.]
MKMYDVVIIGGGPAGSIAAIQLRNSGYSVKVIEKLKFPRFVIGESLLPRCNELLEEVGMLNIVEDAGFQLKGGVTFENEENNRKVIHFTENLGQKHNSSFQVRREIFDKLLFDNAEKLGASMSMETEVIAFDENKNIVTVVNSKGEEEKYQAKKVIDASGYGRVLPRLLNLETHSSLSSRRAIFCRVQNDSRDTDGTDGYITVYVVGDNDAWIWNIPLSSTETSVGIVCSEEYFQSFDGDETGFWNHVVENNSHAKVRYANATKINDVGMIGGYSSDVTTMFGANFVLVGNATEFLDPIFSSGVTLALESGVKAANLIIEEFKGKEVDWKCEYEDYMMIGINVFREYVNAWYDGRLQTILFSDKLTADKIERKVVSVLSGYVWDESQMFVHSPKEALERIYHLLK